MKIAIEGMDGVGKSTIALKVAKANNMMYLEKPLKEFFNVAPEGGKEILANISEKLYSFDDEIIKAWFFGMGNLYSFLMYKNDDLVIDRHFASNYFWNGTPKTNKIFSTMIELIGKPDITIVLYASVTTRLKRLHNRNPNDYDLTDPEKHVNGYDKMIRFLDDFNIPYVVVDTENKNEKQVFDEVNSIIQNLKIDTKQKILEKYNKGGTNYGNIKSS